MIKRFWCWLGFHDWLVHKVEPIVHEKYESLLFAGCSRCPATLIQVCGWRNDKELVNKMLDK